MNRLGPRGSKLERTNVSLWAADKCTKSKDLFDYIISGMRYPVVSKVEERAGDDSSKAVAFTIRINDRDIWFHTTGVEQRHDEMVALFKDYIKAGCPQMKAPSAENIVIQARQRVTGEEQLDPVKMFGFKFAGEV